MSQSNAFPGGAAVLLVLIIVGSFYACTEGIEVVSEPDDEYECYEDLVGYLDAFYSNGVPLSQSAQEYDEDSVQYRVLMQTQFYMSDTARESEANFVLPERADSYLMLACALEFE